MQSDRISEGEIVGSHDQLAPDTVVNERFRILSQLGQGGMSVVYEAQDESFGRLVALKFMRADELLDDRALKRFQREAAIVGDIRHPNIVEVYNFGISNGRPYMAMELVRGKTLGDLMETSKLDAAAALPIFLQVCDALACAHSKGIVHRDLKPSNVMLVDGTVGGAVKLVDFGIARLSSDGGKELQKLTQTGSIVGSVGYMSPEQCTGAPVDERSDIYSMGCLMYHALSGTLPFIGQSAYETIAMHMSAAPRMVPGIPAEIFRIITWCMEKDPSARPQSAEELKEALSRPAACRPRTTQTALKPVRRKKNSYTWVPVAAASAVVLLGCTALLFYSHRQTSQRSSQGKDELLIQADKAARSGDIQAAISYANSAIGGVDEYSDNIARCKLARLYRLAGETQKSHSQSKQALHYFTEQHAITNEMLLNVRLDHAITGLALGREHVGEELSALAKEFDNYRDDGNVAICNLYSGEYEREKNLEKAIEYYRTALPRLHGEYAALANCHLAECMIRNNALNDETRDFVRHKLENAKKKGSLSVRQEATTLLKKHFRD